MICNNCTENYQPLMNYNYEQLTLHKATNVNSNNFMQQHSADHALFEWLQHQVVDICPTLIQGRTYPLRTICGEDLWLQMDGRQRRMVEQFLGQLIEQGLLDLRIAYVEHGNTKLYRLK